MKKTSHCGSSEQAGISLGKLTIGLDLEDRSSWYCVLDEAGEVVQRGGGGHDSEGDETSIRGAAAQPGSTRNRNALTVGEPVIERTGP